MKHLLICVLTSLLTLSASTGFAHSDAADSADTTEAKETDTDEEPVSFGFDLLPFVGTSSAAADKRRNVSINLGGGLSGGINSFEAAAGFNITTGDVRGAQVAGGFNIVASGIDAAQGAGGFNIASGSVDGGQFAGGFNVSGGDINGAQAAGGFNVAGGEVDGAQAAGGFNFARAIAGAQVAGGINIAAGPVSGVQVAPLNIAGDHVNGVQVGVINIAKSADAGIGLIGIYWDGFVQAEAFGSDDGLMMAGIRHGSGSFYNVYFAGTRPFAGDLPLAYGLGFGWRTDIGSRAEFSLDATATTVMGGSDEWSWDDQYNLFKLRPMLSFDLVDGVALFGGPTATVLVDNDEQNANLDDLVLIDGWRFTDKGERPTVAIWPGFTVGARFF